MSNEGKRNKSARERYAKDLEKFRKKGKVYYQKNKEKEKARWKKYRVENSSEIEQRRRDLTCLEVYSHYSKVISKSDVPVCACVGCGEKHIEFLTLDHINGRKSIYHAPSLTADKLCRRLKRDGYPKGIQVLCWN